MANFTEAKNLLQNAIQERELAFLNSKFPNEFEYYAVGFELLDVNGNVVDNLFFPVNPSSVSIQYQPIVNVKKTNQGVDVVFNNSFQPFNINLNGNFGRRFKILLGREQLDGLAFRLKYRQTEFTPQIKTGYGVVKVLEELLKNSTKLDSEGRPFLLIFHNLAFNQSVVVEPTSFNFNIGEQKNLIWEYNVSLKAVAPSTILFDQDRKKTNLRNLVNKVAIQKNINNLINRLP